MKEGEKRIVERDPIQRKRKKKGGGYPLWALKGKKKRASPEVNQRKKKNRKTKKKRGRHKKKKKKTKEKAHLLHQSTLLERKINKALLYPAKEGNGKKEGLHKNRRGKKNHLLERMEVVTIDGKKTRCLRGAKKKEIKNFP